MSIYRYRRSAPEQTPKIEVPKLTDEQLTILSALLVINASEGYLEAERWLCDFEINNGLEVGSLSGFLDFFCPDTFVN